MANPLAARKAGALGMHRVLSIGEICSLIGIAVC